MKTLVCEGLDRCGKSLLIKQLCEYYNFDNVTIRHFTKPLKGKQFEGFEFQKLAFAKEFYLLQQLRDISTSPIKFYDNILIWNRSHIGEICYGPLYRNEDINIIKEYVNKMDQKWLCNDDTYLIYLYGDAEFLVTKEDGKSYSKTIEEKQKELDAFEDAINFSSIKNKIKIKVNKGKDFINKDEIFQLVLKFINNGK
jgi:hypothetical protein